MSLRRGHRVRIDPTLKERLPPPFSTYAANGHVGVLTEEVEAGAWRIAFESPDVEGKTHHVVLRHNQMLDAVPRRVSTLPRPRTVKGGARKRGLFDWLRG
jgi:hypothetical protein